MQVAKVETEPECSTSWPVIALDSEEKIEMTLTAPKARPEISGVWLVTLGSLKSGFSARSWA
jgi:hypothetical protein